MRLRFLNEKAAKRRASHNSEHLNRCCHPGSPKNIPHLRNFKPLKAVTPLRPSILLLKPDQYLSYGI